MQRTREPPLSSGATSAIIKPTNLRWGLPPLPRFIDPTSTRPPLERGQEAVSSVSLSLSLSLPQTFVSLFRLPTQNRSSSPCFFRSLLLILRLVDGGKKDSCSSFFERSTISTFPPSSCTFRRRFRLGKRFHRIDPDRFLSIRLLILSNVSRIYLRKKAGENRHFTSRTQYRHTGENGEQIRVTDTRETYLNMFYLKGRKVVAHARGECHRNESHSSIIRLSLSSSMIGERAMEVRKQRQELSRIGEINVIPFAFRKDFPKILYQIYVRYFLTQFNNRVA